MALDPPLPEDFPKEPYLAIQKRVSVDLGEAYPEARREFTGVGMPSGIATWLARIMIGISLI
jgi:hypothetical protein